ncbi:MAG: flagellar biosynthesis protein FlhB [Gammaproteobacteria bacterium]|nr:flagellar biosynthesis protein FlhB [Gammaproteobacteria bacterium]
MAESNDGQEKTELPTEKRIKESREKGQVARSKELGTFAILIAAGASFLIMGDSMMEGLLNLIHQTLTPSRDLMFDAERLPAQLLMMIMNTILVLAPFFGVLIIAAIISGTVMSGWNFSTKAFAFKGNRLDPIKGIGRIFGWKGLVEMLKSFAKFLLVAVVAIVLLRAQANELIGLGSEALPQGLAHMASILSWDFLIVSAALLLVVAVDIPFQLWDHQRQMKMTKQEIKEEGKQTEGSPEVKGRQRRIQMEMAQRRMMESVPEADVIITNPTHYAVALKYDSVKMSAPQVVAKGADLVAAQIKSIAKEHDVPIVSAPPLARAIFYSTKLEQAIPEGLYRAVAQVLAYIFQLKRTDNYEKPSPTVLNDLPIPDDLRHDE